MLKPPLPGMTDTLEFVKQLWGSMQVPGTLPTSGLSVDDLDKKIADLKAVESWLNLNLGMLRGTIQAMEIQRGTLATLRAMGDSMAQALHQTGSASDAAMAPFSQYFSQAAQATASSTAAAAAPAQGAAATGTQANTGESSDTTSAAPASDQAMSAALGWWNVLQNQFQQAVGSAMPPDPQGSAKVPDPSPAPADANPPDPAGGGKARRTARTKVDKG